jgi:hypothetical protein
MLEARSAGAERTGKPQMTQMAQMGEDPERSGHPQTRTHCQTAAAEAKSEARCQMLEVRSEDTDRRGHPQITQITQIGLGIGPLTSATSAVENPGSQNS